MGATTGPTSAPFNAGTLAAGLGAAAAAAALRQQLAVATPQDYYQAGDGADWQPAFKRAMDALVASSAAVRRLLIPALASGGSYGFASQIDMGTYHDLEFEGVGGPLLEATGTSNSIFGRTTVVPTGQPGGAILTQLANAAALTGVAWAGDKQIVLASSSDPYKPAAGAIVYIKTGELTQGSGAPLAQFDIIDSYEADGVTANLRHGLIHDFFPFGDGYPCAVAAVDQYVCHHIKWRGLRFKTPKNAPIDMVGMFLELDVELVDCGAGPIMRGRFIKRRLRGNIKPRWIQGGSRRGYFGGSDTGSSNVEEDVDLTSDRHGIWHMHEGCSKFSGRLKFVCGETDFIESGTAQAGAAGSITLASAASAVDAAYAGWYVVLVGGAGAGQVRQVSTYTGSTRVAAVSANWTTNPDSTSQYGLFDERWAVVSLGYANDINLDVDVTNAPRGHFLAYNTGLTIYKPSFAPAAASTPLMAGGGNNVRVNLVARGRCTREAILFTGQNRPLCLPTLDLSAARTFDGTAVLPTSVQLASDVESVRIDLRDLTLGTGATRGFDAKGRAYVDLAASASNPLVTWEADLGSLLAMADYLMLEALTEAPDSASNFTLATRLDPLMGQGASGVAAGGLSRPMTPASPAAQLTPTIPNAGLFLVRPYFVPNKDLPRLYVGLQRVHSGADTYTASLRLHRLSLIGWRSRLAGGTQVRLPSRPGARAAKTGAYTLTAADHGYLDVWTTTATVTVPAATSLMPRFRYEVMPKTAAVTMTIDGPGATNPTLVGPAKGVIYEADGSLFFEAAGATTLIS